jgi:hypothetical protein
MDIADQSISLTEWSPVQPCRLRAGRRGLVDL